MSLDAPVIIAKSFVINALNPFVADAWQLRRDWKVDFFRPFREKVEDEKFHFLAKST